MENNLIELEAKWYVKQILDAIDCEDQSVYYKPVFYINMPFDKLQELTKPASDSKLVLPYFNKYLQKYKDILKEPCYDASFHYVSIVISDILYLGDSEEYPKGLQCPSEYFEDVFEDVIYSEAFLVIGPQIDNRLAELRKAIYKQRQIDDI
jgi:hypothetical protein